MTNLDPEFVPPKGHSFNPVVIKIFSQAVKSIGLPRERAQALLDAMLPELSAQRERIQAAQAQHDAQDGVKDDEGAEAQGDADAAAHEADVHDADAPGDDQQALDRRYPSTGVSAAAANGVESVDALDARYSHPTSIAAAAAAAAGASAAAAAQRDAERMLDIRFPTTAGQRGRP